MKKILSIPLTALLVLMGLFIIVAGVTRGMTQITEHHSLVLYTLGSFFLALLLSGLLLPLFAVPDYRKVLRRMLLLLTLGMLMQYIFFGTMWMLLEEGAVGILLSVMLPCYGLLLVMAGFIQHFLSQDEYRPFLYEFFSQLPYAYYRYRI